MGIIHYSVPSDGKGKVGFVGVPVCLPVVQEKGQS
jgi:hypothetical protein